MRNKQKKGPKMRELERKLSKCHEVIKLIKWLCEDRRINDDLTRQWIRQYILDWMKGREIDVTDNWMFEVDGINVESMACEAGKGAKRL